MKTVVFLTLTLLLFSCSSQEQKAKRTIREYFRLTLNDYKSYEPVEYGEIEKLNASSEDLKLARHYLDLFIKAGNNEKYDSASYYQEKAESIRKFISPIPGWKMTHTFRARVPSGGYKLFNYLIYFDEDFLKVTKYFNLSE